MLLEYSLYIVDFLPTGFLNVKELFADCKLHSANSMRVPVQNCSKILEKISRYWSKHVQKYRVNIECKVTETHGLLLQ